MKSIQVENHGARNEISRHDDAILDNVHVIFKGNDNRIIFERVCLNNVVIEIHGSDNEYQFVEDCCVCNFRIQSRANNGAERTVDRTRLLVGRAVQISEGSAMFGADDTCIEIHHATTVVKANFFAVERETSIVVGERCLFSWNIDLRTSDWHSVFDMESGQRINPPKSVVLGPRVWIGSDVRILKGVTIGEGSVVGVGSIVTKDVPANCAAAGNPARVIRHNVRWNHDSWVKGADAEVVELTADPSV
ncbi:2,3,4,5-tetrahydropyridine-2,6-dicarboxylate N-acetyltransferase [Paraburkholderia caffeinitolerans]|uniref:2,3,4,5-tetrahydropyridine-2,6-dicarboxylate N-acetyltransferase n=1 Tax=Paraburkholderia caffeinitolerans TaxID=1723730 RepID=A0A6J5FAX1_9BURK|nr:acyltransferase [Paraburkholderia caffeinitolerans]CAB3776485.1 2,3,4,5-tetrahydropyridine-2,6-dicarboxylate N-acetyltransferase [Paraburkholderia caffeinitolerans]